MSTLPLRLNDFLFGQTRGRVLSLLYNRPEEMFFLRAIAREVKTSVGAVRRELENLSELGIIERTVLGRQVFYKTNRSHPIYPELSLLIRKTVGIFYLLTAALEVLRPNISLAFIYGSVARQREQAESDVDLMIVGDVTMDALLIALLPVERTIGRSINPAIYSEEEFKAKLHSGNHFLKALIGSEMVFLIGDKDELRAMG